MWFRKKVKTLTVSSETVETFLPSPIITTIDRNYIVYPKRYVEKLIQSKATKAFKKAYGDLRYKSEQQDCDDYALGLLPTLRGKGMAAGFVMFKLDGGDYHMALIVLVNDNDTLEAVVYNIRVRRIGRKSGGMYNPADASQSINPRKYLTAVEYKLSKAEVESIYDGLI